VGTLIDQLFQGYFSLERSGGQLLESRYDPLLVTLSYLIAVFAVYTTIGLVAHMRREFEAGRQKNRYWWAGAALTLGGGIFVMHFVAMLAFSIQVEVRYDLGMTLLSLLVAVVGSAVALMQIRGRLSFPRLIWGGVWMGGGLRRCTMLEWPLYRHRRCYVMPQDCG
jgi:NO-binding membrane sensor protein with MHYT domain